MLAVPMRRVDAVHSSCEHAYLLEFHPQTFRNTLDIAGSGAPIIAHSTGRYPAGAPSKESLAVPEETGGTVSVASSPANKDDAQIPPWHPSAPRSEDGTPLFDSPPPSPGVPGSARDRPDGANSTELDSSEMDPAGPESVGEGKEPEHTGKEDRKSVV